MASVIEEVELLHIAGSCYRHRTQPIVGTRSSQHNAAAAHSQDWQVQEELEILTLEDEAVDESLIEQNGDVYSTKISVDSQLLPFIIGRGGNTKKQIEQETGAALIIPRGPRQEQQQKQQQSILNSSQSDTITIKGSSKQAVSSARVRTQLLIDNVIGSKMLDYTHFVSIPLANKAATAKLHEFQQQVLSQPDATDLGLEPSIFNNPQHLHLTVLMLKLYSDEVRHKAVQTLQGLKPQVQRLLGGAALRLSLKGLDYMSDDPMDIRVLYLKVHEVGPGQKLGALCKLVMQAFEEAGLVATGQRKELKLHATIINTRHRRSSEENQQQLESRSRQQGGRGFNGHKLLQDHQQLQLGEFAVPALHLSIRGVYDSNNQDYYSCLSSISLVDAAG